MTHNRLPISGCEASALRRFAIIIAAVLVSGVQSAQLALAGEPSIEAAITSRNCQLNEVIIIQITIRNPTQATMPTAPTGDDYEVQYSGGAPSKSTTASFINGRVSQEVAYVYTYELTPLKTGKIRIGEFTWKDGRQTFTTDPFDIYVKDTGNRDPLFFARVISRRKTAYVGEPLQLALEIWVKKYSQSGIGELDPNNMFRRLDGGASDFGIFSEATSAPPKYRESELPTNMRDPQSPQRRRARTGNTGTFDYLVFIWEITHVPHTPGKLDFGDIVLGCNYPVRLRQPMFFRLEDAVSPRRLRTRPELPDIEIKPVPLAGRPDDYNGAIGTFKLITQAAPTAVPVGDPITLTLNLESDDAPLEGLSAPKLSALPVLTRDFEVSSESLAGEVQGTTKVFAQTIRPLREDVREVPPIPFSYFDPVSGQYQTAWSDPIPLRISPADRVAIAAADEHDSNSTSMAPLVETTDGLQANHADIDALIADQSVTIGAGSYALLGGLPAVYLVAAVATRYKRKQQNNAGARRRSRALRDAKSRLGDARTAGDLLAALLGYVADRFDAPSGSITRQEAVNMATAHGASTDVASKLDSLLALLEAAQYAGATGLNLNDATQEARSLLAKIDSEVNR